MTTLQQLQTSCLGLLFSTQAHKVGFSRLGVQGNINILSEREQYLLGLYDRLGEVCLERRVLEAELEDDDKSTTDEGEENLQERTEIAESELLQSTAKTQMKDKVLETTLITHPILKAVHSGAGSTVKERALLPLIQRRDMLSLTHANLSQVLTSTLDNISQTQAAIADALETNRQLAARLLALTEKRKKERRRVAGERDERYDEAEKDLKNAKVRWEIMRNAVQAIIVGSGVDWAGDARLRKTVLACGEDVRDDD
ncbi:centromere protein H (CENP-H)-domain-containing protein [Morchella snyderi]|nr:centromere protein H (CENP-H)-domain-containing protein [Morchella snyderi]